MLVNLRNFLKATPEDVVTEKAHVKKKGKMKDIMATVKTLASTTTDKKKDNEDKKFPYFCPVCPLKNLASPDVVQNHYRGKTHKENLINLQERQKNDKAKKKVVVNEKAHVNK